MTSWEPENPYQYEDYDSDDAYEDDDSIELVPCPNCGAEVYEEAEQCPECGEYMVHDTGPFAGKPKVWVVLSVCVVILLSILLLLG